MFAKSWTELISAFRDTSWVLVLWLFNVAFCICLKKAKLLDTKLWKTCHEEWFKAMFKIILPFYKFCIFMEKRKHIWILVNHSLLHYRKSKMPIFSLFFWNFQGIAPLLNVNREILEDHMSSSNLRVKHFNCWVYYWLASVRERNVFVCLCASQCIQVIKGKRSHFCSQVT